MADDWAGLAAQLGKMQQIWYVTQRSYWNVFDPASDTATIMAEDGSTRQVPSWRGITNTLGRAVSLDTEQTITAIKTHTARIASSPPGDGWGTWTGDRWPSLQLSCPDTAKAYMVWRATEWGNRHLAALDVHGGGGANITPYVSLHIAGLYNAHVWNGGDYKAAGTIYTGQLNSGMAYNDSSCSLQVRNEQGGSEIALLQRSFSTARGIMQQNWRCA